MLTYEQTKNNMVYIVDHHKTAMYFKNILPEQILSIIVWILMSMFQNIVTSRSNINLIKKLFKYNN